MPLYEYECKQCHRRTEKIQKFSDPEITVCPHCGGELVRTITAAAVSFKGGGWFKDGYGSSKPAASSDASKPSGSTSSDSKSDSSGSSTPTASATPAAPAAAPSSTPAKS